MEVEREGGREREREGGGERDWIMSERMWVSLSLPLHVLVGV